MAGQIKPGTLVRIKSKNVPKCDDPWFVLQILGERYLCERHVGFSTYIFQKHEVEPWTKE